MTTTETSTTMLRALTADVPNPKFDRRRRYGIEAVQTFKAGTRFVHTAISGAEPREHIVILPGDGSRPHTLFHRTPLFQQLLDRSDPVDWANWGEFLAAMNEPTADWVAPLVLDRILQRQLVPVLTLKALVAEALDSVQ